MRRCGVLGLVKDHKRIIEGAAPHVGQRCDLDDASRHKFGDDFRVDHFPQRVVEGPQVGVDFVVEGAGEESEFLPRLYGRPGQDDSGYSFGLEGLHRLGHGQVGFAGAGRA